MGKSNGRLSHPLEELYRLRQRAEENSPPQDEAFAARWPHLFALLSSNGIGDGKYVDGCSLTLRNASGDWRIGVSCPGLRMYGDILGSTFEGTMQALEEQLAQGRFAWKVDVRKSCRTREDKAKK
jgi:hypothetical protein